MHVLRALPAGDDRWKSFITMMTHNENIKTFSKITKHLELEYERLKACAPPPVALVARANRPKGKKFKRGKKKSLHVSKKLGPRGGIAKKQPKAKGIVEKNMAHVRCYNCRKKGHYARDYPKPSQVPSSFPIDQLCELLVCFHAFVANSFPNWIVDSGASKHVVRDRVGFVNFHPCPMGLQTVTLGNGTTEDILGVETYRLKLHGGNSLLLHNALYALGVRCSLVSYVSLMKLGSHFVPQTDGLDILYGSNLFGHASLIDDFLVLDVDEHYYNKTSFVFVSSVDSNSDSVVWHARLGHIGQDRMT